MMIVIATSHRGGQNHAIVFSIHIEIMIVPCTFRVAGFQALTEVRIGSRGFRRLSGAGPQWWKPSSEFCGWERILWDKRATGRKAGTDYCGTELNTCPVSQTYEGDFCHLVHIENTGGGNLTDLLIVDYGYTNETYDANTWLNQMIAPVAEWEWLTTPPR